MISSDVKFVIEVTAGLLAALVLSYGAMVFLMAWLLGSIIGSAAQTAEKAAKKSKDEAK